MRNNEATGATRHVGMQTREKPSVFLKILARSDAPMWYKHAQPIRHVFV